MKVYSKPNTKTKCDFMTLLLFWASFFLLYCLHIISVNFFMWRQENKQLVYNMSFSYIASSKRIVIKNLFTEKLAVMKSAIIHSMYNIIRSSLIHISCIGVAPSWLVTSLVFCLRRYQSKRSNSIQCRQNWSNKICIIIIIYILIV